MNQLKVFETKAREDASRSECIVLGEFDQGRVFLDYYDRASNEGLHVRTRALYVAPEMRGDKHGKRLLAGAIGRATRLEVPTLVTHSANERTTRAYQGLLPEHALSFERMLPNGTLEPLELSLDGVVMWQQHARLMERLTGAGLGAREDDQLANPAARVRIVAELASLDTCVSLVRAA